MKYIRTKDGKIVEIKDNMIVKQSDVLRLVYKDKPYICVLNGDDEIIKQADNIEDLCNEFVYGERLICKSRLKQTCEMLLKEKADIYGAIWTDNGLIYVAKMNQEGELELWQD